MSHQRKMKTISKFILNLILIIFLNCGLFEKRYPPAGEFCDVMQKPPVCIYVNFQNKFIEFSPDERHSMDSVNRVRYFYYPKSGMKVELSVMTEHRVKLSDGRFFLRRKSKR